jgi:hypothetical protein
MKELTYNPLPRNPMAENTIVYKISHCSFTNNEENREIKSRCLVVVFISKYMGQISWPTALAI